MGTGYMIILLAMGASRELLGSGKIMNRGVFGSGFEPLAIMLLSPGAFLALGMFTVYSTLKEKMKWTTS